MSFFCLIFLLVVVIAILSYLRASKAVYAASLIAFLVLATLLASSEAMTFIVIGFSVAVIVLVLYVEPIRAKFIEDPLFRYAKKQLPELSDTEEQAIAAGTVSFDAQLFTGEPNWDALLATDGAKLSKKEQAFLRGPVEKLCQMMANHDLADMAPHVPDEILDFLKDEGFIGMIVPKKFDGNPMSEFAIARVEMKVVSCGDANPVNTFIIIPNSLGPSKLIAKYGTKAQQEYYLPRFAKGDEIPCFALTSPLAGSDAGSISDYGIICKGEYKGEEVIGMKLNFSKRYITLAPVSTIIGLAFKLYDPDHLIGKKDNYGITVALIPSDTKGVTTSRYHHPLGNAFINGPIQGVDVFVPLEFIIGGKKMAGQGWRMLVECLSAGRAGSVPNTAVTSLKVCAYVSSYYARIRNQFNVAIGGFEGVQEALANIAGYSFMADALHRFTLAAVDRGEQPSVPSAICKYHCTELSRKAIDHAMDIHGGKGVMTGPKNYLHEMYVTAPINITVEGANILTRSMIIFGQGAIRCHPYLLNEMIALKKNDKTEFNKNLNQHIAFFVSNVFRSFLLGITDGYLAKAPKGIKKFRRYYQKFTRYSSILALVSDVSLLTLGGALKRKESLSARLADILSMLYMGSAVLKRYHELGEPETMESILSWSCDTILMQAEEALHHALRNYPIRSLGLFMRFLCLPLGRRYHAPSVTLNEQVAQQLMYDDQMRDTLCDGIYQPDNTQHPYHQLKTAATLQAQVLELQKSILKSKKSGKISGYSYEELLNSALEENLITQKESKALLAAHEAMLTIVNVDDFNR